MIDFSTKINNDRVTVAWLFEKIIFKTQNMFNSGHIPIIKSLKALGKPYQQSLITQHCW